MMSLGFTPASAGNISMVEYPVPPYWVHPRIRGEYHTTAFQSPVEPGFTPASAGNISMLTPGWRFSKVHPRIRGEYPSIIFV